MQSPVGSPWELSPPPPAPVCARWGRCSVCRDLPAQHPSWGPGDLRTQDPGPGEGCPRAGRSLGPGHQARTPQTSALTPEPAAPVLPQRHEGPTGDLPDGDLTWLLVRAGGGGQLRSKEPSPAPSGPQGARLGRPGQGPRNRPPARLPGKGGPPQGTCRNAAWTGCVFQDTRQPGLWTRAQGRRPHSPPPPTLATSCK